MSRAVLAGFLAGLGFVWVASATYGLVLYSQRSVVSSAALALMAVTTVAISFLGYVYGKEPRAGSTRGSCFNCGRRVFLTARSLDRRQVLTCFTCGSESLLPILPLAGFSPNAGPTAGAP